MPRTRKSRPPLTADQRRRQIVDLLARHLARMPGRADAPQATPSPPSREAEGGACYGHSSSSRQTSPT